MPTVNFGAGGIQSTGTNSGPWNVGTSWVGSNVGGYPTGNLSLGGTRVVSIDDVTVNGPRNTGTLSVENVSGTAQVRINWNTSLQLQFTRYLGNGLSIIRGPGVGGSADWTNGGLQGNYVWTTVPSAPRNLRIDVSGSFVRVRVDTSSDNGGAPISNYTIQIRAPGSTYGAAQNTRDHTYDLTGFPPQTYDIRVFASNKNGNGAAVVGTATVTASPPSAPTCSIVKNKRDVTVSLTTASAESGVTISGYTIQRRDRLGDGAWSSWGNSRTTTTSNRTTTYTGLTPGRTYQFRGRAESNVGSGEWSNTPSTTISSPPAAPSVSATRNVRNITVVSGIASSASDVTISEYSYQIRSSTNAGVTWGNWSSTQTSNTTNRTVTYSNLNPSTTYQTRARAESDFGSGTWGTSNVITLPPPPSAPPSISPVRSLRNVQVTAGASSVQDSSVVISSYTFQRRESTNGGLTWGAWGGDLSSTATNRVVTFSNLNSSSTYQFRVRAESNFGPSDFRTSGNVFIPGIPDAPQEVMAIQLGADIQVIVVQPLRTGGASVLSYSIERRVSSNNGQTWSSWGNRVVVPFSSSVHIYRDLDVLKTYQFRALATNEIGDSESFTLSRNVFIPAIMKIYNEESDSFNLPKNYKRYNAQLNSWIGLSIYKRYSNGQWIDLT